MATRKAKPAVSEEVQAPAKKAVAKKPAKATKAAKKVPAKKTASKKAAKAAATESATVAVKAPKPDAKKGAKSRSKKAAAAGTSILYIPKEQYNEYIASLMDQGLDREDAILTVKVGIRQANGRPLSMDLLHQCNGDPRIAASDGMPTFAVMPPVEERLAA